MKRLLLTLPLVAALASCGSEPEKPTVEAVGKALPPIGGLKLDANGLPDFRSGLWEVTSTKGEEVETRRACRAAGVDDKTRQFILGPANPGCRKARTTDNGGLQVVMRCEQPGAQVEASIGFAGSDTRYKMTMETAVTSADGSRAAETTVADAQWVSECPAGVLPGEAVD